MHTTISEISEHLTNLSRINSQEYLESLKRAVANVTDTTVKPAHRAPQLGETSVFITEVGLADQGFSYKKYSGGSSDVRWIGTPNITDKFRAAAGLYWTDRNTQTETHADTRNQLCYMVEATPNIGRSHIPIKMHFSALSPAVEDESGATTEWVLIEGNQYRAEQEKFEPAKFQGWLNGALDATNQQFDHTMSVIQFAQKSKIETKYGDALTGYADIHGDYNYFDRRYEETITNAVVKEPTMPNMYVFFAYQDSENPNPSYRKLLSLGEKIDLTNHQDMFSGKSENAQIRATPSEKYFAKWCRAYGDGLADLTARDLSKSFQNIMFSAEDLDILAKYNVNKEMFPMWMHIEFTTDKMTEFAEALKDSQLMGMLQHSLLEAMAAGSLKQTYQTFEAKTVPAPAITAQAVASTEAEPPLKTVYATVPRGVFDLTRWINNFLSTSSGDSTNVGLDSAFSTFLGTYDSSTAVSNDPKYDFFKSLMAIILKGKIKKLLRKHTRTVQEVFTGRPCYHETVLYKVTKYLGENARGKPVQSFYLPNSNDLDIFKYIDTQVKYDVPYTYVVTGFELVVGNKYSYEGVALVSGKWAAVLVKNEPSLRLVEVEMYRHTNRVLDNPPIHPEVEFIPYRGINNRIKILMNSGIGRYDIPFEIIESGEQSQVDKHKRAQNKSLDGKNLEYETDDYPAFYEIWRLDRRPKSFSDFSERKVHHISTSLVNTKLISSGIAIDDKICPNKKYYYCIRSIDNHGHISYPSPIYEVEMVDDKGSVFPIVKLCEFAPKIESQPTIGGKRYIHIKPTMPQTLINEEASNLLDANSVENLEKLTLGQSEESLWGKKFKIRLVSKSTGRKMDFNVTFEHKHMKLENRD